MGQSFGAVAMIDQKTCLLWSKMPQYTEKLKRTSEAISQMLRISAHPYIAFSCGKDSSVLADLVLSIDPSVTCRFISSGETRIVHNVDDVIRHFTERYGALVEEINIDRVFSVEWEKATFDEQRKAGRRDIQRIDNHGYDGVFMGLRKEESRGRKISLSFHKTDGLPDGMYRYSDRDFYRMCPLADWKTQDIGAYIAVNNIPMLDWYREYGFEARTTARITGDAVRQNVLFYIHKHNPAGYQKLVKRFPELRIY